MMLRQWSACTVPTRPWVPFPVIVKLCAVGHACQPSTQKAETGRSEVHGDPWLWSRSKVTGGYVRGPYLKKGRGRGDDEN